MSEETLIETQHQKEAESTKDKNYIEKIIEYPVTDEDFENWD